MTLTDYIKILKANLLFIVIICMVSAAAAFFSTNFLKSGFADQKTLFLTINDSNQDKNNLDSSSITDTIVAVLSSPNLINSQNKRGVSIDAKKRAPQIIDLTVTSNEPQLSTQTSAQIVDAFNSNIGQYVPGHNLQLAQISQDNTPTQRILNSKVLALAGAIFGFLLATLLILIARYFKV